MTRREFLRSAAAACLAGTASRGGLPASAGALAPSGENAVQIQRPLAARLGDAFPDLARHFVFEYYPWYRTNPYNHWNQWDRQPPIDLASSYMPLLGAYDSLSTAVLEQHARWILQTGARAIDVSWWGPGSLEDQAVPRLMDVMAAHDIHVAFHLEPYADARGQNYARDIQYLITEYGDRRHWDCFLLLQDANGAVAPVFKSFATILPQPRVVDCHGVTIDVYAYTADSVWRQQADQVRELFRHDFDRVTLLADSVALDRVVASGFDGIALYDNFIRPDMWFSYAQGCTARSLLFSFNTNPGFDSIAPRQVAPDACFYPSPFEPPGGGPYDWSLAADRERAEQASLGRITDSFRATLSLQTSPILNNAKRGFLLIYINSFNEWHEGHQFEPMKDAANLTADERAIGYHNPANGSYRLSALTRLLGGVLD
jgi:hypothetical protein